MEWAQFLILIVTIGGLFLWNRSESNSDRRAMQADMKEFRERWAEETKDFHARLLAIEERRNKFIFKE